MTIYKSSATGKEKTNSTEKEDENNVSESDEFDSDVPIVISDKVEVVGLHRNSMRRHHVTIFKCFLLFGIFTIITLIVAGSIYFYLHHKSPNKKPWTEMCRVRYHEWMKSPHGKDDMFLMEGEYHQQIELDIVGERYEKLNVPSLLNARRAVILHDMEMGLTAVIDQDHGRCFVKKINSTLVKPIGDFFDLVQYNKAGYYLPDAQIVYENYTVKIAKVEKISQFGKKIFDECRYFDTYNLIREQGLINVDDNVQKSSCPYKGDRYCLGNSGSKYMLIFTITDCAD